MSVRKVEYYTVKVSQRPGAGAALLAAMKKARDRVSRPGR